MSQVAHRTPVPWTEEEYLDREERSDDKHELIDGQIYAMAGSSPEHSALTASIIALLHSLARRGGCQVHTSDMRIRTPSGRFTYPDASVVCGPPQFLPPAKGRRTATLLNPSLVVEVLSPSTEVYDRGEKFADYRSVPSLNEVLFIDQHQRRVEHHRRVAPDQWLQTERSAGHIEVLGGALSLDELYQGILPP